MFLLSVGQADVFVSSKIALVYFLNKLQGYETSLIDDICEDCSIAFSKQYAELANQVQNEIHKMKMDGTINAIFQKWGLI